MNAPSMIEGGSIPNNLFLGPDGKKGVNQMRNRFIFLVILLLGIALLGLPEYSFTRSISYRPNPDDEPYTIAVMPFANLTGHKEYDWLSIGISEVLTTKLGSLPYFRLVERIKLSEALKEIELGQTGLVDEDTAPKVGKMIGADELVIGSFQIVGENIRIDARFLDVESGRVHVFSGAYGELDKVFEVQDRIAASCLESLNFYLTNEERTLLAAKPTTSMDAYKLYSQAVDTYTPEGKALDDDQRITYLQQSTWIDPNFAMAYSSLGDLYAAKKQDYSRAVAYYQKVVVLQPLNLAPRIWLTRIYQKQNNALAAQQEDGKIKEIRQHLTPPRVHTIRPPDRLYINQMKSLPVNQGGRQYIPPRVNNVRPAGPLIRQHRPYRPPTYRAPIGGQPRIGGRGGGGRR